MSYNIDNFSIIITSVSSFNLFTDAIATRTARVLEKVDPADCNVVFRAVPRTLTVSSLLNVICRAPAGPMIDGKAGLFRDNVLVRLNTDESSALLIYLNALPKDKGIESPMLTKFALARLGRKSKDLVEKGTVQDILNEINKKSVMTHDESLNLFEDLVCGYNGFAPVRGRFFPTRSEKDRDLEREFCITRGRREHGLSTVWEYEKYKDRVAAAAAAALASNSTKAPAPSTPRS